MTKRDKKTARMRRLLTAQQSVETSVKQTLTELRDAVVQAREASSRYAPVAEVDEPATRAGAALERRGRTTRKRTSETATDGAATFAARRSDPMMPTLTIWSRYRLGESMSSRTSLSPIRSAIGREALGV